MECAYLLSTIAQKGSSGIKLQMHVASVQRIVKGAKTVQHVHFVLIHKITSYQMHSALEHAH